MHSSGPLFVSHTCLHTQSSDHREHLQSCDEFHPIDCSDRRILLRRCLQDRIQLLLGVDPANFIRLRSSDIFCCGTDTSRPIEVLIWKVEDIRSAVPVTSNNLYTEVVYGFNGNMCTRVHNNCGSNAIFRSAVISLTERSATNPASPEGHLVATPTPPT